jgi:hypothetical protein
MADKEGGKERQDTPGVPAAAVPTVTELNFQAFQTQIAAMMAAFAAQAAQAANAAAAAAVVPAVSSAVAAAAAPAASNDGAGGQQLAETNEKDNTALHALNTAGVSNGVDSVDGTADAVKRHFPAYDVCSLYIPLAVCACVFA